MKSLKIFLGTVLCLVMISSQAMAMTSTTKILNFDNVPLNGLGDYGKSNHVQFSNEWYLAAPVGNIALQEMSFGIKQTASLQFYSNEPVGLISFGYI